MTKFEEGKTYYTRANTDSDFIIWAEVVRRTPKMAFIKTNGNDKTHGVKIFSADGYEYMLPWGRYSMAPCISADRVQS